MSKTNKNGAKTPNIVAFCELLGWSAALATSIMVHMTTLHALCEPEVFETLLEQSQTQPIIIFKHSNSCPFSAAGHRKMRRLARTLSEGNDGQHAIYMLVVQQAPLLSKLVEDKLEVSHETPQAIVIERGEASHVFNHEAIDAEVIKNKIS